MFTLYENDTLYLKPLVHSDLEDFHAYVSDPDVKQYIGWPLMTSLEMTKDYLDMLIQRHEAKTHVYASVVEKSSNTVVGTLMLFGFDEEAHHCEIGYVFAKSVWGKGYGTVCAKWFTDLAFTQYKQRKVFARIVHVNKGSGAVLEKNGFTLEGTLKDYYFINEAYSDCQWFGKLNPAY